MQSTQMISAVFSMERMVAFAALLLMSPLAALAGECKVRDPELQGFYEGGCRNGWAHGRGHAKGEAEYTGDFVDGYKEGQGVKTWTWGDRYEGGFLRDRRHGKGMYTWGPGSPWAGERYVGDYVADKREGQGSYWWPNGDRFDGVWKQDLRYGYTAMEQRRQAAEQARAEALQPGTRVCAHGKIGLAHEVLRVGEVQALEGNILKVRLVRSEGSEALAATDGPQPGDEIASSASDWVPCL